MMKWFTEHLLKTEIRKLTSKRNLDEHENICLIQYQKELKILERLKIEGIDMRGSVEDLEERLKENSIYFMEKKEYSEMYQKSVLFDAIKKIVNQGE